MPPRPTAESTVVSLRPPERAQGVWSGPPSVLRTLTEIGFLMVESGRSGRSGGAGGAGGAQGRVPAGTVDGAQVISGSDATAPSHHDSGPQQERGAGFRHRAEVVGAEIGERSLSSDTGQVGEPRDDLQVRGA